MIRSPLSLGSTLQKKVDFARLQIIPSQENVQKVLECLDLTSLTGKETPQTISDLCDRAVHYNLASVCILPEHVKQAAQELKGTDVKVATVINFPYGNKRTGGNQRATTDTISRDIWNTVKDGARQVDIVQPYSERPGLAHDFIRAARVVAPSNVTLKVILESAAFNDSSALFDAALIAIASGADCIKTSTGKHPNGGATLEAAAIMLDAINHSRRKVGIKITGGISSLEDCLQYMALKKIFSNSAHIDASNFRIGASRLLDAMAAAGHIPEYRTIAL